MHTDSKLKNKNAEDESDISITVQQESENTDILSTKTNPNYVVSDADVLHNFIKSTLELRELVKCPLCLDVMKKPIEISCSHCFCEKCFSNFLEEFPDKPLCPVCRVAINKRSRKDNVSLLGYISFINDVNKELNNCLNSEVTDLKDKVKIKEKLELIQKKTPRTRAVSVSSSSDIIPGTVPQRKRGRPAKNKVQSISVRGCQKKRTIEILHTTAAVQNFENNENRNSIIVWLNDNKNKFDKITQSQQSVSSSKFSQESFDLPSVSQLKNNRPDIIHTILRPRGLSLNIENKVINYTPRVRYNSWPSENLDEYLANEECLELLLEESKKTAELKQKEEEFLECIENEMEMESKKKKPEQTTKKRKRKSGDGKNKVKKFNPLIPLEGKKFVNQKNCDLETVEAYFNENLSKITNNGADLRRSPTKVVPLGQNNARKTSTSPKSQDLFHGFANNKTDNKSITKNGSPSQKQETTNKNLLLIELETCIEKIEHSTCDSRIANNCLQLRKYAETINKILNNSENYSSPKSEKISKSDVETQTEIKLVDAFVQTVHQIETNNGGTLSSTVLSEPFNGSLISKLVQKYGQTTSSNSFPVEEENHLTPKASSQVLSENSFDKITFKTQDLLENQKKSEVIENQAISNSFDGIDFDTQQLIEKHNKLANKSAESVGKKSINKKLDYSANQEESQKKKFKRIRTLSDSDSDAEMQEKKRNKYLQEDISVRFESEVPADVKNSDEDFRLSDDVNYNVFVDKILKKYEKPSASTQLQNPSTSNYSNDVIERCDKIIKQVEKIHNDSVKPSQINQPTDDNRIGIKSQKEKYVFSSDEPFNDENVLNAIERDIEENLRIGHSSKSEKPNVADQVLELNDSFNDDIADFETPNVTVVQNKKEVVKVLQNIAIVKSKIDSDEEIFSDVDVVENTPPRDYLSDNDEVILPPPPEFQCDNITITNEFNTEVDVVEKTLTENEMKVGSATPDFLSPPHSSQTIKSRIQMLGTSTPISGKIHSINSLSISPIGLQRHKNPFEVAKNVKHSPLTVVEKKIIIATTPKQQQQQQQSILNYVKPVLEETNNNKKPCVACSRLETEHMIAVSTLANKKLAVYTSSFAKNVTHVVVAVNENNCVRDHTMKYVCGVAAGIWIVNIKWVQECLVQNKIVAEEPYEVKDVSGVDGPRQSRLTRAKNPLFKGFKIFAAPPFLSTTQADIENVVKMLGGTIVSKPGDLLPKQDHICVIISEASATQDFEIYESWLETFKVITVDIEWLSRSVGQYKVMSLRPFALCSEDLLDNLGYPEEMVCSIQSYNSET